MGLTMYRKCPLHYYLYYVVKYEKILFLLHHIYMGSSNLMGPVTVQNYGLESVLDTIGPKYL